MGMTRKNSPVRGDRLCFKDILPPRWGLNGYIPLQGLRSASPRYTPAYDLVAPNGAVYLTTMLDKFGGASATDASIMAFGLRKSFVRGGCRCRGWWAAFCPRAGPSGCSSCRHTDAPAAYRPPPRQCPSCCPGRSTCLCK